jgi:hypothetical protein
MRTFNLMAMSLSKLPILRGIRGFVCKTEKGNRSAFSPISPRPVFESWIFSQFQWLRFALCPMGYAIF